MWPRRFHHWKEALLDKTDLENNIRKYEMRTTESKAALYVKVIDTKTIVLFFIHIYADFMSVYIRENYAHINIHFYAPLFLCYLLFCFSCVRQVLSL